MDHSNKTIEDLMQKFRPIMGADHDRYKNHVYRVFLNCLLIDSDKTNEEKYAIAAVFHDIGIWTNHTFDYLSPSAEQARIYLSETGKHDWTDEISQMINWHHKMSKYKGNHSTTTETFRKADWIDVSLGLLTFGNDKQKLKETRRKFPNLGFHSFLVRTTIKNFFRHPLNPLPMFKK
ncbi:MAG TPA: HD domain-containing protein [Chitinophagaceae bacterium]